MSHHTAAVFTASNSICSINNDANTLPSTCRNKVSQDDHIDNIGNNETTTTITFNDGINTDDVKVGNEEDNNSDNDNPFADSNSKKNAELGKGHFANLDTIVMALDDGQLLHPLSSGICSALLPLHNLPLIAYQLHQLFSSGCVEALVFVFACHYRAFSRSLKSLRSIIPLRTRIKAVADGAGTADALRTHSHLISRDFIVVDACLVCDLPLQSLMDVHLTYSATLTILTRDDAYQHSNQTTSNSSHSFSTEDVDRLYLGVDSANSNHVYSGTNQSSSASKTVASTISPSVSHRAHRIVYMRSAVDREDEPAFKLSNSLLRRFSSITVHTQSFHVRACVMSHWVLDLLHAKKSIVSIDTELVPYLVDKQFRHDSSIRELMTSSFDDRSELPSALALSSSFLTSAHEQQHTTRIQCYTLVCAPSTICSRVCTLRAYRAMSQLFFVINRQATVYTHTDSSLYRVAALQRDHSIEVRQASDKIVLHECKVADNVRIGHRSCIQRSVIGANVSIGEQCRIKNCILMHNVTIHDGVELDACVVAANAVVLANASLTNCNVGTYFKVLSEAHCHDETLFAAESLEVHSS